MPLLSKGEKRSKGISGKIVTNFGMFSIDCLVLTCQHRSLVSQFEIPQEGSKLADSKTNQGVKMASRKEIETRVIDAIKAAVPFRTKKKEEIKQSDNLADDLGMKLPLKQAMGVPYTEISKSYPGGIAVSLIHAGECKTVREAVDLTHRRANGLFP